MANKNENALEPAAEVRAQILNEMTAEELAEILKNKKAAEAKAKKMAAEEAAKALAAAEAKRVAGENKIAAAEQVTKLAEAVAKLKDVVDTKALAEWLREYAKNMPKPATVGKTTKTTTGKSTGGSTKAGSSKAILTEAIAAGKNTFDELMAALAVEFPEREARLRENAVKYYCTKTADGTYTI